MPSSLHKFLKPLPSESPRPKKVVSQVTAEMPWDEPKTPEAKPGVSGLRYLGAMGTRGLAAWLSAEGMLPGALIAGAGEGIAETLEGDLPDWKRMAAESAIGAVPLASVFKGAHTAEALTRGALYGGSGEALHELARGEDLSASSIGTGAAVGAGTSGLVRFLHGKLATSPTEPKPTVPPPSSTGWSELSAKGAEDIEKQFPIPLDAKGQSPNRGVTPKVQTALNRYLHTAEGPGTRTVNPEVIKSVTLQEKEAETLAKTAEKQRIADAAADKVDTERQRLLDAGAVPKKSVSSSVSAPGEGGIGKTTVSERLVIPTEEEEAVEAGGKTPISATPKPDIPPPDSSTPDLGPDPTPSTPKPSPPPSSPSAGSVLMRFFKRTTQDLAGKDQATGDITDPRGYFATQASAKAAATAHVDPVIQNNAARILGKALRQAGKAEAAAAASAFSNPEAAAAKAGRPFGDEANRLQEEEFNSYLKAQAEAPVTPPVATEKPPITPEQQLNIDVLLGKVPKPVTPGVESGAVGKAGLDFEQAEHARLTAELKAAGGGDDRGSIPAGLLMRLGLAGAGAATGYATDPLDDPYASAAAGGVAGMAGPDIIRSLTKIPNLVEKLKVPGGLKELASKIGRDIPQIQRFNLLMSVPGLAANAVAGPAGSVFFGAIEYGLSGDPRGWKALRILAEGKWKAKIGEAFAQAQSVSGRAEGTAMNEASNAAERLWATPGVTLSTGDILGRDILMEAGFTEEEARRMTLTSEPWSQAGKNTVNLGRNSPLMQMLAPFRRTAMNIAEQGAERTPGIGFLVNKIREANGGIPDSNLLMGIKQGMGVGTGLAGYEIGSQLSDDDAKLYSRFVTNFAGANSLPAAVGFAAGRAEHAGKHPLDASLQEIEGALPLPTTRPLQELVTAIRHTASGNPELPRAALPAVYRELREKLGLPSSTSATKASGQSGRSATSKKSK